MRMAAVFFDTPTSPDTSLQVEGDHDRATDCFGVISHPEGLVLFSVTAA